MGDRLSLIGKTRATRCNAPQPKFVTRRRFGIDIIYPSRTGDSPPGRSRLNVLFPGVIPRTLCKSSVLTLF